MAESYQIKPEEASKKLLKSKNLQVHMRRSIRVCTVIWKSHRYIRTKMLM